MEVSRSQSYLDFALSSVLETDRAQPMHDDVKDVAEVGVPDEGPVDPMLVLVYGARVMIIHPGLLLLRISYLFSFGDVPVRVFNTVATND